MVPLHPSDAVIAVDVQNDFCPGGALAVPAGDEVVPVLNRWIDRSEAAGATVVVSRDWHPADHCSFEARGGPWPVHCVRDTPGAGLHRSLHVPDTAVRVDKGTDVEQECYSGFAGTGLGERLRRLGVRRVFVGGLALDYCVKATVLDALAEGFETHVLLPASRAVNFEPGDDERALEAMTRAGAIIDGDPS
jgi:nicotinamidase/pyrazinamidase